VDLRTSTFVEADQVLALGPDVVIVATGGSPRMPDLSEGVDLAISTWDIIGGSVSPSTGDVLLFDDHGTEEGLSCVERLVAAGSCVELVTPDRHVGHEVTGTAYPRYLATFYEHGVRLTPDHRMTGIRRDGAGRLEVDLWNDYTKSTSCRTVDQVVVAYGTTPNDGLYLDLIERASNRGELDLEAFLAGRPQTLVVNEVGTFQLFRTGDAVASRNIHAAIYEARRLAMTL
jgi:pyruvate/2-oxoglutarate dehydrogenase complex dihydrolipoamide dehydrogenase (E3) component